MRTLIIILTTVFSGVLNGSYAAPTKLAKKWEWENTWLIFSISGLIIIPWLSVFSFVPGFSAILSEISHLTIFKIFLFGLGWGIGSVAFGLALHLIGFSLGYTLMMGLIAVIGALVPLIVRDPSLLFTPGGIVILIALALTLIGITFCGYAGKLREKNELQKSQKVAFKYTFKKGLILCFIAGLFSSMLNFSFEYGIPLRDMLIQHLGNDLTILKANTVVWAIAFTGGSIPFLIYCIYLLFKNDTWNLFFRKETYANYFLGLLMGMLFFSSFILYGWSAAAFGSAGTTIGWIIFIASAILMANVWGWLTGEWTNAGKNAIRGMMWGSFFLILAVILTSIGNSMFT